MLTKERRICPFHIALGGMVGSFMFDASRPDSSGVRRAKQARLSLIKAASNLLK
jgi:hypothetical protein